MPYTFLLGGARSGKSSLAVRMAAASEKPVAFLATAEARDAEMTERIRTHRRHRPASWETVEAPLDLLATLAGIGERACVVLDCLTLWVSNELEAGTIESEIEAEAGALASALAERNGPSIVVSNEVGLGIVPMHELARSYRDVLGRVNATFAEHARRSFFVVAGRVLPLEDVTI